VTLTGSVASLFCRAVAENAVGHVKGVKEVVNRIDVVSAVSPRDVQREISRALHRNAELDSRGIEVTVTGNKVRLDGTVSSWREREAVECAASHAGGIAVVDNRVGVRAEEPFLDDGEIC
jgi:osmotically-inducible protein OsmY